MHFFCEGHGFASVRGTVVLSRLFRKGKKTLFLFFFFFRERHGFASARGTVVLSREARACLFRKGKKHVFCFFFLSREARFCFRQRHGCAFARGTGLPPSEKGKNVFSVFFFFRERHGFAFARGTVVLSREARACLFRKGKKTVFPVRFFRPVFFVKKKFVKTYQHGI